MSTLRIARKLVAVLTKDRIYYPDRLVADTFAMVARCGLLLFLYAHVFALRGGTIQGVTFSVAAWSMFFYFAFHILRLRDIAKAIMQDVQSGNVELLLARPFSYLAHRMWWQVGSGLYSFLAVTLVGSTVMAFTLGIPDTMRSPVFLPSVILVIIGGIILSLMLYSIVGLLAFWIEEVNPVFWIVDKTVMILGGSYLPIALFPPSMYLFARYSPFGATQFITHTVYDTWEQYWLSSLSLIACWTLILGVAVFFMYQQARRKVSVHGG